MGFGLFGIPHVSMRLRSRKIRKNVPSKVINMLDAGFGSGIYSFTLASKVKSIAAVDIEKKKVDYARKVSYFKNVSFQLMDLTKLTFEDSSFDFIICSEVLEHIKNHEAAFSELARVLRKGGTMLVTVPYEKNQGMLKDYTKWGHERPGYTEKSMHDLCLKNGLTLVKCEGWSSQSAEKAFEINYKMAQRNKIMCSLFFYPLYAWALLSDFVQHRLNMNELFFKIIKE